MFRSICTLLLLAMIVVPAQANRLCAGRQWVDGVIQRLADAHQLSIVVTDGEKRMVVSVATGALPVSSLETYVGQNIRLEGIVQQGAKGFSIQPIQLAPKPSSKAAMDGMEACAAEIDRLVNLHLTELPGSKACKAPFIRVGPWRGRTVGVTVSRQSPTGSFVPGEKLNVDLDKKTVTPASPAPTPAD